MPSINPNSAAASAAGAPPPGPVDGGAPSNTNHVGSGRSPPERHPAQMMMGPGYPGYPPPPGYPPYNASSSPPSDPSKGPPPHQYGFPPGGFSGPYGQSYPPPYAGNGYPPYPNRGPWYGNGYGQPHPTSGEGRYPLQVQPSHAPSTSSRSTRGGRAAGKLPYSPPRLSNSVKAESAAEEGDKLPKPEEFGTKKMDDLEAERVRNAEAAELRLSEVKPIQSEFHFFVADMRDKLKEAAEKEVMESLKKKGADVSEVDPFLVYTNLNDRLMRAWETLPKEERDVYAGKEEDDRCRFMEEDEVASRHCFTLTARVRAEQRKENTEKGTEQSAEKEKRPRDEESDEETSAKKIRLGEDVVVAKV